MKKRFATIVLLMLGLSSGPAMGDFRFHGNVTEGTSLLLHRFPVGSTFESIALFLPGAFADGVASAEEMGAISFRMGSVCWVRPIPFFPCSSTDLPLLTVDYANIFGTDNGLNGQIEFTGGWDGLDTDVSVSVDMVAGEFMIISASEGYVKGTVVVDMYDDYDNDAAIDPFDNCVLVFNPTQYDADNDGIGNACDPDFNNDCIVNFLDVALFAENFSGSDMVYDLNENGAVEFSDFAVVVERMFRQPGPVGTIETTICASIGASVNAED